MKKRYEWEEDSFRKGYNEIANGKWRNDGRRCRSTGYMHRGISYDNCHAGGMQQGKEHEECVLLANNT